MHGKRASAAFILALTLSNVAWAQTTPFEKKNYTYSEWTKGRFSEAVTVTSGCWNGMEQRWPISSRW